MSGNRQFQRFDFRLHGAFGLGHKFVRERLLQVTTHLLVLAVHGRFKQRNQLLEFVFGKALVQHGTYRRRRKLESTIAHHGQHVIAVLLQVGLNIFGDRIAFVGWDTGLHHHANLLHHDRGRLFRQHACNAFDRRLLQLQDLRDQFFFGRRCLGADRGAKRHQRNGKHAFHLHADSFKTPGSERLAKRLTARHVLSLPVLAAAGSDPMTLHIHITRIATAKATLVHDLDLLVSPGVIHTVMGASGSGKSSLLAAVCGTLAPELQFEGRITLQGRRLDQLPTEQRQVGILFQDALLFAHMTVAENLLFALAPGPLALRKARVAQSLSDLEMTAFANADPAILSGGQRARVALMRAVLAEPRALLLDEPFSRLDADLRARIRQFVFELVSRRQIPVLLVTHDAADIADAAHLTRLG